jgi:D-psicose/D-tagatose/L-ribulose 3-epimerase
MAHFVNEFGHQRVRANIDISHLVLSDTSPADLAKLKSKAIHVHISDCDGKVHGDLPPGRGIVKFEPYLRAIKGLDINGTVAIELEYSPDPSRIVEWVEEAYTQTISSRQPLPTSVLETPTTYFSAARAWLATAIMAPRTSHK